MNDFKTSPGRLFGEIFLISFIVLVQELAFIRWMPGQVRVLAYFPNLILISAFLGLGIGCLQAKRKDLMLWWPISVVVLVIAGVFAHDVAFTQESASEHLWLLYFDLPEGSLVIPGVKLPIVVGFCLSCLSFVPLGQGLAKRIDAVKEYTSALWAYVWDLAGSLAGVVMFALLGFLETEPVLWFLLFLIPGFLLFPPKVTVRALHLLTACAISGLIFLNDSADYYSPYYALREVEDKASGGVTILTNGSLHQMALPLNTQTPTESELVKTVRKGYHLPYETMQIQPKRGLVLGAGSGNDVAVMLEHGIEHVDVVEIDPVILRIGKERHPDRPYDDPRVKLINTDARSYLQSTTNRYDLIVFGTLDSMTRLSALSNVRLDNFVYTRDCIEAAKALLNRGGGVVMYFAVEKSYINTRLFGMLSAIFGRTPIRVNEYYNMFNHIYMAGPAFDHIAPKQRAEQVSEFFEMHPELVIPDDDWPFLYLRDKSISGFYAFLMICFSLIALVAVFVSSADIRQSAFRLGGVDLPMILFGFAFLLLESKAVTSMNLVWGATWISSAVVFASILLMILIATIVMAIRPMSFHLAFLGLGATLLVSYFVPYQLLLGMPVAPKLLCSLLLVGTPIFFAGVTFAILFDARTHPDLALGWNLFGAVLGGLAEFFSMQFGLHTLLLFALLAYLLAYLIVNRKVQLELSARLRGTESVEASQPATANRLG